VHLDRLDADTDLVEEDVRVAAAALDDSGGAPMTETT